jgi:hypothetical protein
MQKIIKLISCKIKTLFALLIIYVIIKVELNKIFLISCRILRTLTIEYGIAQSTSCISVVGIIHY